MSVRDECKRRYGDGPCIKVYAADYKTVVATHECIDWCPALNRIIEDAAAAAPSAPPQTADANPRPEQLRLL